MKKIFLTLTLLLSFFTNAKIIENKLEGNYKKYTCNSKFKFGCTVKTEELTFNYVSEVKEYDSGWVHIILFNSDNIYIKEKIKVSGQLFIENL